MKQFLLSLAVILLFFSNVNAQVIVNAGASFTVCTGVATTLGGSPTASGGTPPYTYAWSPSAGLSNPNVANPIATPQNNTVYYLTVTDNLGAQGFDSVTISVAPSLFAVIDANDTVGCLPNGFQFTSTVNGGNPPYAYTWDFGDGTVSTVANPQHAFPIAGQYLVYFEVTDGSGCRDTDSIDINVLNCGGGFNISHTNATCFGSCDGSAEVFPTGNYNYLWNNAATTATIGNLCAGNYSVTVMDSVMNPLDTLSVTITQPTQIVVTAQAVDVTCFGGNDGSIFVNATGGTPPFVFLWNNGMTTMNAFNLPAGTYAVTVVDGNNCSASASANVQQPTAIAVSSFSTDETTAGTCDGSIDITVNGGVAAYSFFWSNNVTTEDITNLCPGAYTVTITDANGCTATTNGVVGSACPNNTIVLTITSTGNIDCNRTADTLTAVASGGTTPYTYWWSNAATTPTIVVNQPGVYTAYVTDMAGCTRSTTDTVQNLGVNVTLQSSTPVLCNGTPNGNIKINVSGGVPPYTFVWSNGATTDSIANLASGTYTVTVSDAASCVVTFSHFLNQTGTSWSYYVYASTTQANCGNNGTATALVQGGTGPYTYLWNTTPPQTTQTATDLAPGHYTVTVTGSNGCTRTGNATVYTSCSNIIKGYLFNDTNGNCQRDSGEIVLSGRSVTASGSGSYFYGYSDFNGYYSIRVNTSGSFTVSASSSNGWGSCAPLVPCGTTTVTFSNVGDTVDMNFGFGGNSAYDLSIHPGWTSANPGFQKDYWVLFGQNSQPYYTGPAVVTFTYDTMLQYISCTNGCVHNALNHTVVWNLSSMPSSWANWATRHMAYFTVPANTPVGYQLRQEFSITPTSNDCDLSDNYLLSIQPVTGSMDPNEKEVKPAGDIVEQDSVLTYTIHFQNTGNDTTWFIILKDTLSQHLNPATVQNISSSHPYTSFEVSDQGILTWLFNPIFLVDSATNEPASKGYVTFKVKKKPGLPLTTQISNKASIYFDYNEPIVTNTVTNTITEPNFIFTVKGDENISVTAMPNPFKSSTQIVVEGITTAYDFELFDVTGKTLTKINALNENRFELKRDDLSAGVYFYCITTTAKQRTFGKLVVE